MPKKDYTKSKIAITLDRRVLKKIDKIKEFPRWRGNRSEVIEESLREFLTSDIKKESKCIFCGCNDSNSCQGGCYWVIVDIRAGKGVCSKCAFKIMQNPDKLKDKSSEGK